MAGAALFQISRYSPAQAAEALRHGATLIDLRHTEYRWRFGEIPGAVPVSRHVAVMAPARRPTAATSPRMKSKNSRENPATNGSGP